MMWISNDFDLARDGERRLQKDIRISAADRRSSMLKEQEDYSEQDLLSAERRVNAVSLGFSIATGTPSRRSMSR
jgi:hypothetical protein